MRLTRTKIELLEIDWALMETSRVPLGTYEAWLGPIGNLSQSVTIRRNPSQSATIRHNPSQSVVIRHNLSTIRHILSTIRLTNCKGGQSRGGPL